MSFILLQFSMHWILASCVFVWYCEITFSCFSHQLIPNASKRSHFTCIYEEMNEKMRSFFEHSLNNIARYFSRCYQTAAASETLPFQCVSRALCRLVKILISASHFDL